MAYLDDCTRVYRPTGRTTHHLLPPGDTASSGVETLCGIRNSLGRTWLGTGGQEEYEKAASLPVCKRCEAAAEGVTS